MERHRLERAAAEKARVEAAAVTAKLEATALADAARREKDRTVEVATVRSLRQNLELQSRPWRDARARRTKGVDWTPTHKPIFISYAPTQDATYDELAFCQKMVETLNEPLNVIDYQEYALNEGSQAQAICIIAITDEADSKFYGVGLSQNTITAAFGSIIAAINRKWR